MQLVEKQILSGFRNHPLWVLQDYNHLVVVRTPEKGDYALCQWGSADVDEELTVEGSVGVVPKVHVGPCESGDDPLYSLSIFFPGLENLNGAEHRVHRHFFSSLRQGSSLHPLPSSFVVLGGLSRLFRGHALHGDCLCLYLRDGVCVRNRGHGVPYLCLGHGNGPCFDCDDVHGCGYCSVLCLDPGGFHPVAPGKRISVTSAYEWYRLSGFET